MAGRCVLIQAVLNALPQHFMLSAAMPISATMDIELAARSFLWNGAISQSKIHTVSWEVITRPKTEGGLGLRRLPLLREAMLGTLAFKFIVNSSVISSFFALKYKWNGNPWEVEETRKASQVWRSICRGIKLIRPFIRKIPGAGYEGWPWAPPFRMEVEAIRMGLKFACAVGFANIQVCSDCLPVIQILQAGSPGPPQIRDIMEDIYNRGPLSQLVYDLKG
ncbi:hypothetical protein QJS10_CPA01g03023 [Acorus calamus]|uniref:RNase H type-1 domain-containing protein n=1 Tax=Acorus calamus TaxID=4465 RepID=A0AAV9FRP1_ACOCL|nr:hypothetical protein QJS10_CPA01g03023 [Acorus calamus]